MSKTIAPYEPIRLLRPIGYTLSLLLFFLPIGEIIATGFPFFWGQALWRYSLEGMAGASSATMLVGAFLMLALATFTGHRAGAMLAAVLALVVGILYLVAVPFSALDAIQLKANSAAGDGGKFKLTAAWIMFKLAVSGIAFLWIAVAGFRARNGAVRPAAPRSSGSVPPIVGAR